MATTVTLPARAGEYDREAGPLLERSQRLLKIRPICRQR